MGILYLGRAKEGTMGKEPYKGWTIVELKRELRGSKKVEIVGYKATQYNKPALYAYQRDTLKGRIDGVYYEDQISKKFMQEMEVQCR